ncbi:GTP cyclohydrolase FolE2 [Oceanobacillus jeddahense]|uniref:GTP cyclohydrolase FolE2 n=1 Tax=Oceanobacillus jeddahense TaxID=1462527 RepID=A0ABY5JLU9_9BACI|nr:GTP cyclohydrolase FolE2 [Oceanobacillus jeddahense]UUI01273.1 GTP cyclohydrolase FolE2 [Oceanobacillus jeddahense]
MQQLNTIPFKKLPSKEERHKLFGSVPPGEKKKPTEKNQMADLQNVKRDFLFDLDVVGVANVKYPVRVLSGQAPFEQTTVGTFTFSSSIPANSKGTNMSRFMELLEQYHQNGFSVSIDELKQFTKDLAIKLEQPDATISVTFPWFYERKAPQTSAAGLNHAEVSVSVRYSQQGDYQINVSLNVQITTLCPCSKEISEYSAHNQRGNVTIETELEPGFSNTDGDWKVLLLEAAESNASARLHPILKRPDEKMVTESAYENPRFVEDMVRLIAADLYELSAVMKFHVACRNEESIHMHDAVASVTYDKRNRQG